jgi:arylsulfatase A-like enzyme
MRSLVGLSLIVFLSACATTPAPVGSAATADRPNILFIYTDDQSHRTVSCYDAAFDWVRTPNIDSLAKSGTRFTHAYIGAWCMPSRATLLTGHHQHGIESMRMVGTYPNSTYDPAKCRFWPSVFRKNGYVTAHIGKWHTGVDAGYGRDWDHQIVWNRPKNTANAPNYYDNQLISRDGGPYKMVKGYSTDNYTKWAVEFINGQNRDASKPWYLWLCYGAVHGPFTPADRHLAAYPGVQVPTPKDIYPPRPGKPAYVNRMAFWKKGPKGIPVEQQFRKAKKIPVAMKDMPGRPLKDWIRQYHQGVLAIDEGVGKLLQALKDSGQDENTLVVFTSDQGFAWGQHGFKTKVAPYDGTVRAPLIIRPPGGGKPSVVRHPVSGVDLPPTFFARAGMKLPWEMHGHDLSPLVENAEAEWKHPAMLVHTAKQYGSNTNVVPAADDPKLIHGPGIPWYVALAEGRYKYVRTLIAGETEELYDLQADTGELNNLARDPKHKKRLERFRAAAIQELKRTGAKMADRLPPVKKL